MGKYTVKGGKVDKVVEEDLKIIKGIIIKEANPIAIILFGGFGKGEGSYAIENGKIEALNDYDMYIITRKKKNDKFFEALSMKCSKAINHGGLVAIEYPNKDYNTKEFFHVDLRGISYKNLKKLVPSQRTYEIKNSSQVIYGDENILNMIPDVKVPISDGIRLLFNKVDHLLTAEENSKYLKVIYSVKALLDCCVSLLIFEDKFRPTYSERNKIFKKLDKFPKKLRDQVDWATEFKLNKLDFKKVKDEDKLLEDAKYWTKYSLKLILKNHLNLKKDDWKTINKAIYYKLPYIYFKPYLKFHSPIFQYYLNIAYTLKCWRKGEFIWKPLLDWKDAGLKLAAVTNLYFYGYEEEAKEYLEKISSNTDPLKERILKLYSIYYLQKLI